MHKFDLITHILKPDHIPLLENWIVFLGSKPSKLIIGMSNHKMTRLAVKEMADRLNIPLAIVNIEHPAELKKDEYPILKEQFSLSEYEYSILIKLDTVHFRQGHEDWLEKTFNLLSKNEIPFATGTTKNFRTDHKSEEIGAFMTKRISNNLLIIRSDFWLETQEMHLDTKSSRFYVEACIEQRCGDKNIEGLRLINQNDWRVLHVQVWDERIYEIQKNFEKGIRLKPFLEGYCEDDRHKWERYYEFQKPSRLKKVGRFAGAIKRKIIDTLYRQAYRYFTMICLPDIATVTSFFPDGVALQLL